MSVIIQNNPSLPVSSQPQLNTFHPFPRLPTEIRIIIFHYAALSLPPRTIEIHLNPEKVPQPVPQPPRKGYSAEQLARCAQARIMRHGCRALTPTLFHVSREARAVALALYRPCKIASFDVEMPWMPALAPYMEEPKPPLGGRVCDPGKDTIFIGCMTAHTICADVTGPLVFQGSTRPDEATRLAGWVTKYLARDLAAVAQIESLAIVRNACGDLSVNNKYVVRFLKEYKSLREMILVAFEDCVPCDVSRQLGLEIRRGEVILVDVKDMVDETKRASVDRTIQAAQRWRAACAEAQALDDDGWKAPEIMVKIARRGI